MEWVERGRFDLKADTRKFKQVSSRELLIVVFREKIEIEIERERERE